MVETFDEITMDIKRYKSKMLRRLVFLAGQNDIYGWLRILEICKRDNRKQL